MVVPRKTRQNKTLGGGQGGGGGGGGGRGGAGGAGGAGGTGGGQPPIRIQKSGGGGKGRGKGKGSAVDNFGHVMRYQTKKICIINTVNETSAISM